jgi:diguanylate cyclase (GGDEF)-like protein
VSTDLLGGMQYSSVVFHVWAGVMHTAFFSIAVVLLAALKGALERERALARHDPLTQLPNRTAFFERAEAEVARLSRYGRPLTVAFVDCDNFKSVNDSAGHEMGDKVLQAVATALRGTVRRSDLASRIGGDEFALLFPELGAKEAQDVIAKLQARLLAAMAEQRWPVTFSVGVVTCTAPPGSFDALLAQADALMYQVKNSGRNAVKFAEAGRAEAATVPLPA